MRRIAAIVVVALAMLVSPIAGAATRAWLDRDRIALGETVTLNVESDTRDAPDYAPLVRDFDLGSQGSREEIDWTGGGVRTRALFAVALRPRHDGLIRIPSLRVGGGTTAPITLLVTPAPSSPPAGRADIYIESEADDQDPYVQQSVGWVVRLYTVAPLIAGSLDQAVPPGASLTRVGEDRQFRANVGGRTYTVVERRYLLVPERSGELVIPPARFQGRGAGDAFDRLFGDGQQDLQAVARPRVLKVKPIPANAPRPWLPLRALALRYTTSPTQARAGEAATVVIDAEADGAGAAQMPPITLGNAAGVQVFPERPQSDESFADGRPRAHVQRRFSLVPSKPGDLVVPGPRIAWWDSQAGVARVASLPPIRMKVAPGAVMRDEPQADVTGIPSASRRPWFALAGIALVATTLVLLAMRSRTAQRRGRARARSVEAPPPPPPSSRFDIVAREVDATPPVPPPTPPIPGNAMEPAAPATVTITPPAPPPPPARPLPEALADGDLAAIDRALRDAAGRADLHDVLARLDDAGQRDAVEALQRARWAGGDVSDALARLRRAFAGGPTWRRPASSTRGALPPLYPDAPSRD